MRLLPVRSAALISLAALAAVACAGLPQPSTGLGGSGLPTIPPVTIPPLPSLPLSSIAIPSVSTSVDPALAAKFPTQVAGNPVTAPETTRFIDFATAFQPESVPQFVSLLQGAGMDPAAITFGTSNANIDSSIVTIQAVRLPGGDATRLIAVWPQMIHVFNPEDPSPVVAQGTVGGKTVTTLTPPDDDTVTYLYATGDIVWSVETDDPAEADAVMSAIQ